jgi:hypothetical protein
MNGKSRLPCVLQTTDMYIALVRKTGKKRWYVSVCAGGAL